MRRARDRPADLPRGGATLAGWKWMPITLIRPPHHKYRTGSLLSPCGSDQRGQWRGTGEHTAAWTLINFTQGDTGGPWQRLKQLNIPPENSLSLRETRWEKDRQPWLSTSYTNYPAANALSVSLKCIGNVSLPLFILHTETHEDFPVPHKQEISQSWALILELSTHYQKCKYSMSLTHNYRYCIFSLFNAWCIWVMYCETQ